MFNFPLPCKLENQDAFITLHARTTSQARVLTADGSMGAVVPLPEAIATLATHGRFQY